MDVATSGSTSKLYERHTAALTLHTQTSVCIFSILFSIHFLTCRQGEFVYQSKASLVGDHFLFTRDVNGCFRGDIVGEN